MMCAQMKAFFDATGGHWQKGSLVSRGGGGLMTGCKGGGAYWRGEREEGDTGY